MFFEGLTVSLRKRLCSGESGDAFHNGGDFSEHPEGIVTLSFSGALQIKMSFMGQYTSAEIEESLNSLLCLKPKPEAFAITWRQFLTEDTKWIITTLMH